MFGKKNNQEEPKDKEPKTEEPKEEKALKTYISKYLKLRLVMKPSYTKDVDGRVVVTQGTSIQFNDGAYTTTDKKEIEFLENHKNFGSVFVEVDKKDIEKAKDARFKDLETKEAELKAKEEELSRKEKALREGSSVPKSKAQTAKNKNEKPAFD